MNPKSPEDTIAAISTPPGQGGIGIVRVSGADAVAIAGRVFHSSTGRDLASRERQVYYGEIRDGEATVDEVLVHVMHAPHTYTREDVVEINCHGGVALLGAVLELVLRHGARLAHPGEFTQRAFLSGRIDLIQAEAVIDRIRAQTRAGLRAASAAARGVLSQQLDEIKTTLIEAKAHIEAAIDFPEQDLPELITPELRGLLNSVLERMRALLATADAGRLLREGASIAICGRPNVGKSCLFNALLRDARAIVTQRPGTTRDVIEETIALEGIPARIQDMAGLRDSEDEVERIGIEVARSTLREAAIVLFVVDASAALTPEDHALLEEVADLDSPIVLALNKIDLGRAAEVTSLNGVLHAYAYVSAKTGEGLDTLERELAEALRRGVEVAPDQGMLTRLHQKDSLRRALEATERVVANFGVSPEFMGIELDDALKALGEISGDTTPDEVLDAIFGEFCIGK